jgi:ParB-like nuclease family protein
VKVSQVRVGPRFRKQLGDVDGLAESIRYHGCLLQPIIVDSAGVLISGLRRLEAVKSLGWADIDAVVIDLDDPLRGEQDENVLHKPFTPTEREAIGTAIYDREQEEAKARRTANLTGTVPVREDEGRARDKVAEKVGWSGRTYIRMKRIVEAAKADPERFGDLPGRIDSGDLSIKGAEIEMKNRRHAVPNGAPRKAPAEHGRREGPTLKQSLRGLEQVAIAVQGIAEGLEGQLYGDWSRLYELPEAQPLFDVLEQELQVVNARLRRALRERGKAHDTEQDRPRAV